VVKNIKIKLNQLYFKSLIKNADQQI
jgi:hypothetical protein